MRWLFACVVSCVLVVGCGSTGGDDTVDPGSTLVITPASAQLEIVNGAPATQAFTVALVDPAGVSEDVTARVAWSISDPAFGSFGGATFTAGGARAGKGMVHATLDTIVGDAQVEITIRGVRVAADVPANAPDLFAQAVDDPAAAPAIVYPADQVIVPANLGDLEAHWTDGHGHDLFELSLKGDHVDQRVYVRGGATAWAAFTAAAIFAGRPLRYCRARVVPPPNATVHDSGSDSIGPVWECVAEMSTFAAGMPVSVSMSARASFTLCRTSSRSFVCSTIMASVTLSLTRRGSERTFNGRSSDRAPIERRVLYSPGATIGP